MKKLVLIIVLLTFAVSVMGCSVTVPADTITKKYEKRKPCK